MKIGASPSGNLTMIWRFFGAGKRKKRLELRLVPYFILPIVVLKEYFDRRQTAAIMEANRTA
jgi:hypothetical protein